VSVLDRRYRRWEGTPTPYWQRVLVIPRHGLRDVFKRKAVLVFFVICLLPAAVELGIVYVSANMATLRAAFPALRELPDLHLGPTQYVVFYGIQGLPVLLFALIAGPSLIARDLANNALPLYFSKALRRSDYLLGKAMVLILLLGAVSTFPLMLVFAVNWLLESPEWRAQNGYLGTSILLTSGLLVAVLTALVLAISATVRRDRLARAGLLAILFVTPFLAAMATGITGSHLGELASPTLLLERVDSWAFQERRSPGTQVPDWWPEERQSRRLSVGTALLGLGAWVGASVAVAARKVRPVEVVE